MRISTGNPRAMLTGTRVCMRTDKWLWAARFFKTRALASRACELGRIQINEQKAKPSRDIRSGDTLHIRTEAAEFVVEVLALSDVRGPAPVAQTLYRETEASRTARAAAALERREAHAANPIPDMRPSKRDRRRLTQFRSRG